MLCRAAPPARPPASRACVGHTASWGRAGRPLTPRAPGSPSRVLAAGCHEHQRGGERGSRFFCHRPCSRRVRCCRATRCALSEFGSLDGRWARRAVRADPRRARPLREGPDESHASLGRDTTRPRRPPRAPLSTVCSRRDEGRGRSRWIRTATVTDAPLATSGRRWACACGRSAAARRRSC